MKTKTLFVLGAGSSYPYGLPLGNDLTKQVADKIGSTAPAQNQYAAHDEMLADIYQEQNSNLSSTIRLSRTPTIDAFLRHSPSKDKIIAAMTAALWEAEDAALTNTSHPQDDWLAWLYHNRLSQSPEIFCDNQIAFVSFNYDRLPQAILATMMANTFRTEAAACLKVVTDPIPQLGHRFVHIHGALPPALVPIENKNSTGSYICSNYRQHLTFDTSKIRTMYDDSGDMQSQLNDRLAWAERIVFLGLGYHQSILDRFKYEILFDIKLNKTFLGTAFGLDPRTRNNVEQHFTDDFLNPRLTLGTSDQDCTSFLSQHI